MRPTSVDSTGGAKYLTVSGPAAQAKVHLRFRLPAGKENWTRTLEAVRQTALTKPELSAGFRLIINVRLIGNELQGELHLLGGEALNAYTRDDFQATPTPTTVREQQNDACLFCRLKADNKLGAAIAETPLTYTFDPGAERRKAPLHHILIPNQHHAQGAHWREFTDVTDSQFLGDLYGQLRAQITASDPALRHFRVVSNNGPFGGQAVQHLHFHLLGREKPFATATTVDFKYPRK